MLATSPASAEKAKVSLSVDVEMLRASVSPQAIGAPQLEVVAETTVKPRLYEPVLLLPFS